MLIYSAIGPNAAGDFLIAYPTPGVPHVLTAAGIASNKQDAEAECARLNELQTRKADMIVRDQGI